MSNLSLRCVSIRLRDSNSQRFHAPQAVKRQERPKAWSILIDSQSATQDASRTAAPPFARFKSRPLIHHTISLQHETHRVWQEASAAGLLKRAQMLLPCRLEGSAFIFCLNNACSSGCFTSSLRSAPLLSRPLPCVFTVCTSVWPARLRTSRRTSPSSAGLKAVYDHSRPAKATRTLQYRGLHNIT